MTSIEKEEIKMLPEKYQPMGAWSYFGYMILFSIPIVGTILLIVFALSGNNINRRSFARSYFCGLLIVMVIVLLILVVVGLASGGLQVGFEKISEFFQNLFANIMPQ